MADLRINNRKLSSTALKLLACGFMLCDHVGVRLLPEIMLLRIIGRLAFPLFAFFIGEGCRYTSNRLKHFLCIFALGAVCESVYIIYMGSWYGNTLLTFSLSTLLIYLMQWSRVKEELSGYCLFGAAIVGTAVLMNYVNFDYGFFGVILPLFAAYPGDRRGENPPLSPAPLSGKNKVFLFAVGIMLTAIGNPLGMRQFFALLTVPLLAAYSGKAGKIKLKYFFYIFYPVHMLLIEVTAMLTR